VAATRTRRWLLMLRREHSGAAEMRVSHESIYRDVYMPSRKALDASMFHRLRSDRSIRRPLRERSSYAAARSATQSPSESVPSRPTLGKWPGIASGATRPTRRCAVSHGVADITTQLEWNESSIELIP
jgi:IS30 family transposase